VIAMTLASCGDEQRTAQQKHRREEQRRVDEYVAGVS
jgi:hypothetical protein